MNIIKIQDDWFKNALHYALKSWTSTFNRMGKPNPYTRIEKIILGLIAESAVEKYFIDNNIEYNTSGKTKWYEEDRYDIGIGKYAIDVKSNFLDLNNPYIISQYVNNPNKIEWIKNCHALVPLDQFNPGKNIRRKIKKEKVYIFPFIIGKFSETTGTDCLVHAFWDYKWLKRAEYKNLKHLGNLNITYTGTKPAKIRIYGTKDKKQIAIEDIIIDQSSKITENNFFQVFAIRWLGEQPDGKLTIKSNTLNLEEMIFPENKFELIKGADSKYVPKHNDWQNLAFYNGEVILTGWIDENEMRLIGNKVPRFSKNILQYQETKVDNWGCKISELKSMDTIKTLL